MMWKSFWMFIDYILIVSFWIPLSFARSIFEFQISTPSLIGNKNDEQNIRISNFFGFQPQSSATASQTKLASTSVLVDQSPYKIPIRSREDNVRVEEVAGTFMMKEQRDDAGDQHGDASTMNRTVLRQDIEAAVNTDIPMRETETMNAEEASMVEFAALGESDSDMTSVIYRSYRRKRPGIVGSVPFVLLGPVEHWKAVGQSLASRGFEVMSCERDLNEVSNVVQEGASLVSAVLEASHWSRAILVGHGKEAILAITAAMSLGPEHVAGVVLCGDLSSLEEMVGTSDVEFFLESHLECPTMVVSDGEADRPPDGSDEESVSAIRSLMLGGSNAPHRKLPNHFSWVLSRFVEEKISPLPQEPSMPVANDVQKKEEEFDFVLPFGLGKLFTPRAGAAHFGKVAATFIFYVAAFQFFVYQYQNLHGAIELIHARYRVIASWPGKLLRHLTNFVLLPLFGRSKKITIEPDVKQTRDDDVLEPSISPLDNNITSSFEVSPPLDQPQPAEVEKSEEGVVEHDAKLQAEHDATEDKEDVDFDSANHLEQEEERNADDDDDDDDSATLDDEEEIPFEQGDSENENEEDEGNYCCDSDARVLVPFLEAPVSA